MPSSASHASSPTANPVSAAGPTNEADLLVPSPSPWWPRAHALHRGHRAPAEAASTRSARRWVKVKRCEEGVLTSTIARLQRPHIRPPGRDPRATTQRLTRVQGDLDQTAGRAAPACATAWRWRATAWSGCAASWRRRAQALSQRLVEIYKSDEPDSLTVVLEADGFEDLLERTEYLDRVSDQDAHRDRPRAVLKAQAKRRPTAGGARGAVSRRGRRRSSPRRDSLASRATGSYAARGEPASRARDGREHALGKVRVEPRAPREDLRQPRGRVRRVCRTRCDQQSNAFKTPTGAQPIKHGSGQLSGRSTAR